MKVFYPITLGVVIAAASLFCTFINARAQNGEPENRSSLEFSAGLWTGKEALASRALADFIFQNHAAEPFNAEIAYSYRLSERYALTAGIVLLTAQSTDILDPVGYYPENHQTSLVFPVLLGARYYFRPAEEPLHLAPYLSAAVGMTFGYENSRLLSNNYYGQQHSEYAPSGRLGAGLEYGLDSHVKIAFKVNYFLMSNFPVTVGRRGSYNGVSVLLGTGLNF